MRFKSFFLVLLATVMFAGASNAQTVVLETLARSVDTTSDEFSILTGPGMLVVVHTFDVVLTPTVSIDVEIWNPGEDEDGAWVVIFSSSEDFVVGAGDSQILLIYPTDVDNVSRKDHLQMPVPRSSKYRLQMLHEDTDIGIYDVTIFSFN